MVEDTQKRYADDVTVQELVRLRVENERLREAITSAMDYFDDRADMDGDQENKELHLFELCRRAMEGR